jgi:hypothetical protein
MNKQEPEIEISYEVNEAPPSSSDCVETDYDIFRVLEEAFFSKDSEQALQHARDQITACLKDRLAIGKKIMAEEPRYDATRQLSRYREALEALCRGEATDIIFKIDSWGVRRITHVPNTFAGVDSVFDLAEDQKYLKALFLEESLRAS